jgi:acetyltransferase-like isoleucine patch superfamily enzyme
MLITKQIKERLEELGVTTLNNPDFHLPDNSIFEPPCSIKWMNIEHSIEMGAFSYAVSGYFFACKIGRYCSIGEEVQIGRHPHPTHWFSSSPFFYAPYQHVIDQPPPEGKDVNPLRDFKHKEAPTALKNTEIGNDVWIGHGAFILPGVKIGTGAVIAARSVVTKDVPPYAFVAGVPAVVKSYRFDEKTIERLLQSEWWQYAPWDLKGVQVDDFEAFFIRIESLKIDNTEAYRPEKINHSSIKI